MPFGRIVHPLRTLLRFREPNCLVTSLQQKVVSQDATSRSLASVMMYGPYDIWWCQWCSCICAEVRCGESHEMDDTDHTTQLRCNRLDERQPVEWPHTLKSPTSSCSLIVCRSLRTCNCKLPRTKIIHFLCVCTALATNWFVFGAQAATEGQGGGNK